MEEGLAQLSESFKTSVASVHTAVALFLVAGLYLLSARRNVAHWLFNGLSIWIPPSTEQIQQLAPMVAKGTKRKAMKKLLRGKSHELVLNQGVVSPSYFIQLTSYDRYDKLFFVIVLALGTFFFGELWSCFMQQFHTDYNFLLVASALLLIWTTLCGILVEAGWGEDQVKLSLLAGGFCGLLAYFCLHMFGPALDLELETGYAAFRDEAHAWLASRDVQTFRLPASLVWFRLLLSVWAFAWSSLTLWPKLRHVKSYQQIAHLNRRARPTRTLCPAEGIALTIAHLDFVFPLFLSAAWTRPAMQELLEPALSLRTFRVMRLYLLLAHLILRSCTSRPYPCIFGAFMANTLHDAICCKTKELARSPEREAL
eukprot:g8000.t1